jgi:hypothetical protein
MAEFEYTLTRREFLIWHTVIKTGCPWFLATEAVASTALEHPEWNLTEEHTWAEWMELQTGLTS